ncbi:MAG: hypothetical protein HY904_23010 [Deltaproteobacteria bacterium]|nr:hypothetical protein [Deltaproteobacteria bacterium]
MRNRALPALACVAFLAACVPQNHDDPSVDAGPVALPCPEPALMDRLSMDGAREAFRWRGLQREARLHDEVEPGWLLRRTRERLPDRDVAEGRVCPTELATAGRLLFEHEFTRDEGLGHGAHDGTNPFRRVHAGERGGPDTTTCASCHWRGGPLGAGAVTDNSYLLGDGDDVTSADARNPPALLGAGWAQTVAEEMSAELQSIRDAAVQEARVSGVAVARMLGAKGIPFGVITARADGTVDTSGLDGVDADLVVKPFGWKGTFTTLREFITGSLHVHFGIQSDALGNGPDPDEDGVTHEFTDGQLTALTAYVGLAETPIVRAPDPLPPLGPPATNLPAPVPRDYTDEFALGYALFDSIGCTSCHVPVVFLRDPVLRIASTHGTLEINLARYAQSPRPAYDPAAAGYAVWAFSDFKRHDLGPEAASLHVDRGVDRSTYLTRRLWGLANSGPWFYDGRAASFDAAIEAHGGEAADARDAFRALSFDQQGALRVFLISLVRERAVHVP